MARSTRLKRPGHIAAHTDLRETSSSSEEFPPTPGATFATPDGLHSANARSLLSLKLSTLKLRSRWRRGGEGCRECRQPKSDGHTWSWSDGCCDGHCCSGIELVIRSSSTLHAPKISLCHPTSNRRRVQWCHPLASAAPCDGPPQVGAQLRSALRH